MVLVYMSSREKSADDHKPEGSEVSEDMKENKHPSLPDINISEGISPELNKLGLRIRTQKPWLDNPPDEYVQQIKNKTGIHDMELIKKRYDDDYPIVDPDAGTDWDRRGKPHGFHPDGTPTWPNNEIPKGVKIENMTAAKLGGPPAGQGQAPWQRPGVDHCAARREASSGGYAAHGYSYGGTQPSYTYGNKTPYEAATSSSMGSASQDSASQDNSSNQNPYEAARSSNGIYGSPVTGVGAQNSPADFGGSSCDWQRSHIP